MTVQLYHGDCLEIMPTLEPGSVDAVIADLPYGTTACKWDTVIPLAPLWECYKRVLKPNGAVVLFGSQPFTSALVMSNPEWFKFALVWLKSLPSGFLHAKNRPLKSHEDVLIFSGGSTVHASQTDRRMTYNPQMESGKPYRKFNTADKLNWGNMSRPSTVDTLHVNTGTRYPTTVLDFPHGNHGSVHPTQKPISLLCYLIRTYTNEGETVLDNTMGSGTTGVACVQTLRNFIGIERDPDYFCIAQKRIADAQAQGNLFEDLADLALSTPE